MKKTEHYDLPTWEMTDRVMMSDFNDMTGKIDGALAEKADRAGVEELRQTVLECVKVITGTYQGDGNDSQFISLGVTPKAVMTWQNGTRQYDEKWTFGGVAITGHYSDAVAIEDGGFSVKSRSGSYIFGNTNNSSYFYIALI